MEPTSYTILDRYLVSSRLIERLLSSLQMDLTPIKCRGKRKPARTANSSRLAAHQHLLNPHSDPKGKRPLHSNVPSTYRAKAARRDTTRRNPGTSFKSVSALERLPTEILEIIFFQCLNISLPQASPIIGKALASKHVKSQLVLQVFSFGDCNNCSDYTHLPALSDLVLPPKEKGELQSAILRTRWMTLPFLQGLMPDYIVTTIVRELSQRSVLWLGKEPVNETVIREHLNGPHFDDDSMDYSDLQYLKEISWPSNNRGLTIRLDVSPRRGLVALQTVSTPERPVTVNDTEIWCCTWKVLVGVDGCRVPEKLLHGPWTKQKRDFLEFLVQTNATVDWIGSTSGEVLETGFQEAVAEKNLRVIKALNGLR